MPTLTGTPSPILINQLPVGCRSFIFRCNRLWYGEMRGVRIKNGVVVSVQKCVRHHKPNRPAEDHKQLGPIAHDAFKRCFKIWKEEQVHYLDMIKIESGLPVWTEMDEGAWRNNAVK